MNGRSDFPAGRGASADAAQFHLHPHYRNQRPLDATLLKVRPELDRFPQEVHAERIERILAQWSAALKESPAAFDAVRQYLSASFLGSSPQPSSHRTLRTSSFLDVQQNAFAADTTLGPDLFLTQWQSVLIPLSKIHMAEFQISAVDVSAAPDGTVTQVKTHVRYEIVGSGHGFHREQRIGNWRIVWEPAGGGQYKVARWQFSGETQARSSSPVYVDVAAAAFGANHSYSAQLLHGVDYWRTVLDGACGIDVYGHNGVSAADIDNDGFDDLYVCQPAGLPNRLYRNRGDGTFEDITELSGLGVLENTACALFADFDNDGRQDVILVRANGPLLFLNQGDGRFRELPDAFKFANPPQGTFTGASVADYDRDGWLDIYFCLYSFYQGTGQYKYPSPYHDAENGPPNFLMRNNRDGTFVDLTLQSGLGKNNTRYSFCCGWGDYNNDGWPDLYVVNDFGRKNLYRNNGDGTFTDVAPEAKAEDVGAGMSVSWFDANDGGAQDLYVANMWTAAGVRISMLEEFKKDSAPDVRALYQKHAMGNSLLRNRGDRFEDATELSGTGVGRWSWTSDSLDFDHDGFADLYVVNGMVSGPSRSDLNSFFWRQVVGNSPDEAGSSLNYEQGWNAVNELIRSDETWSGYERNILYANNRDGTFSDVSAVVGLDFIEDGRSFALADFNHDGRQEIVLKNRNTPQLRFLKNEVEDLPPSISFRLKGTRSNRDAIGAAVTVVTSAGRQTKCLQAGSGFLCQHSKDIFFGLGDAKGLVQASIQWPSGLVQQLRDLPVNRRIWVEEGSAPVRMETFLRAARLSSPSDSAGPEVLPTNVETWFLSPIPAPEFSLLDLSGRAHSLSESRDMPLLLNLWTARSSECQKNLELLDKNHPRWSSQGLQILCVHLDNPADNTQPPQSHLDSYMRGRGFSVPILRGSDDVAAVYNILFRQLYDRHRDLVLPTTFLIDGHGYIVKIYQGTINAEQVQRDFSHIPNTVAERLQIALPFPTGKHSLEFGRNNLSAGALFFQRGYLEQAQVSFQQALHDNPESAEALYGIGSVFLDQNQNAAAREMFERCVRLKPNYSETLPDAWNNLGVLATRDNRISEAIGYFQTALDTNPRHLLALDNLGNAYRMEKQWEDARHILQRAIEVDPDDPEANYSLGMVFAQTNDTDKAYGFLQRALKSRPVYPEALNNLGILYLVTRRRDEAVASFEKCIQLAPEFDQAYLNLARVYAIEGSHQQARSVLLDLLKRRPDSQQAKQMLDQLQQP